MAFEQTPEEKLVDKFVGLDFLESENLKNVLSISSSRRELKDIVQEAWRNGASVSEIQKVYDENLARLNPSYAGLDPSNNKENESIKEIFSSWSWGEYAICAIPTIIILALVIGREKRFFWKIFRI